MKLDKKTLSDIAWIIAVCLVMVFVVSELLSFFDQFLFSQISFIVVGVLFFWFAKKFFTRND